MHWERLSPDEFENLVKAILIARGFDGVRRVGATYDKGVDVEAYHPGTVGIVPRSRRWVFQCKRTNKLSRRDIERELAHHVSGDPPDTWVLVTSAEPSAPLRRWFDGLNHGRQYRFTIDAWWAQDLEPMARELIATSPSAVPRSQRRKLGLGFVAPAAPITLSAFVTTLLQISLEQIDRFASGNYIPTLYVHRGLEHPITLFFESEKATTMRTVDSLRLGVRHIADHVDRFLLERAQLLRRRKSYLETSRNLTRSPQRAAIVQLDNMERGSRPLVTRLRAHLVKLAVAARSLPTDRHSRHRAQFDALRQLILSAQHDLGSIPQLPRPASLASGESLTQHISKEPDLQELLERLNSLSTSIANLWKPGFLIIDRAGSGKTNLLCHAVASHASTLPIVLAFGRQPSPGQRPLVEDVLHTVSRASGLRVDLDFKPFDGILEAAGTYLYVVVDGINEHRDIRNYDAAIADLLHWGRQHRVRVLLSCRDVYSAFFSEAWQAADVRQIYSGMLRKFSVEESEAARPAYFSAYHIACDLQGDAAEACAHPLLLRFFCEAYGSRTGPLCDLGSVADLRLKQLFARYWERKAEQIRRRLGHRDSSTVEAFVTKLAADMLRGAVTSILTSQLPDTGTTTDLATQDSLYLQLLDEDIIIEERPADRSGIRKVSFVHEQFMEYMLAMSIASRPDLFGLTRLDDAAQLLTGRYQNWVNARGVAEFLGIILLESSEQSEAWSYLDRLCRTGATWIEPFWSVLAKARGEWASDALYDVMPVALNTAAGITGMLAALSANAHWNPRQTPAIALGVLWTGFLPNVIRWSEVRRLDSMPPDELRALIERCNHEARHRRGCSIQRDIRMVFAAALSQLESPQRTPLEQFYALDGLPETPEEVLRVVWKRFPDQRGLLLNGLFSDDNEVRLFCADRLKYVTVGKSAIRSILLALARGEKNAPFATTLRLTASHIQ
jgi:hypothetical protein